MAGADRMQLTILHTNDIHGHIASWRGWEGDLSGRTLGGFDRLATAVARVRNESKNVLLLDAGDAIGDTSVAASTEGKAVIELMNEVRYDAMTLGNHEPDFGMDVLRMRIGEARFDVLAANVVESGSKQLFTKPYVLRSIGDLKVGILGIAYPNTPLTTAKENVAGYEFRQARETAAEYIPKLQGEGAELIVVLSHLGLGADRKLAEAVPGIDVIVGGHSHNRMKELLRVRQTIIVQSGAHLSDLGRLDVEIEDGKVITARSELITLDNASVPSMHEVARKMEQYNNREAEMEIAVAQTPIVRAQTLAESEPRKRDQESPADSLFADIVRKQARAEVAFLPGVGYGVAIPAGPVRKSALKNLVPHDSKLTAMTLTGADIKDILERSVENVLTDDPEKKVGGMVQVSGLSFTYAPGQKTGSRVQTVLVDGKQLDLRQRYRVATNSMLAGGGHNYRAFTRGADRRELESQYDIIESEFRKRGRIATPEPGRIRNATKPDVTK
jgi:2',3'-cyclic-nucleotide 2'-phosphodiesterase (5'-nucleotidase family)